MEGNIAAGNLIEFLEEFKDAISFMGIGVPSGNNLTLRAVAKSAGNPIGVELGENSLEFADNLCEQMRHAMPPLKRVLEL